MNIKNISVPLMLVLDEDVSSAATVIYLVLKTFKTDKSVGGGQPAVIAAHKELMRKSSLSQKTVVKALDNLEATGWIERQPNSGHPNKYIFTAPAGAKQTE